MAGPAIRQPSLCRVSFWPARANLSGLPVGKGPCRPSLGLAWEYIQGGGYASLSCLGLFSTQDSLGHLVDAIYLDFFSV